MAEKQITTNSDAEPNLNSLFLISSKNPPMAEKQITTNLPTNDCDNKLFLISSKNKLKANHNETFMRVKKGSVVFNILKEQIESKSQRLLSHSFIGASCF